MRWQRASVEQRRPPATVRKVDDDWYILLSKIAKAPVSAPARVQFITKESKIATKTRVAISEIRPRFERRVHKERRLPSRRSDDWFVLFERGLKKSVVITQRGARPVSAPVFSQAALAEAGIPMAPLDQPQTSTPIKGGRQDERRLEVTVETEEITKMETLSKVKPIWRDRRQVQSALITSVNGDLKHEREVASSEVVRLRQDFDKPQEDLLRHHASISELKRNFMEALPESRPSEWDKRLSTHSPFRTLGVNGQLLPGADGPPLVQTQTVTITAESSYSSGISTTEVPIVPTHSITYESSKVDGTDEDKEVSSESSSKTVTSETTSGTTITTTTTHISKVVKSGSSETRVEKRIVITADSDTDQEKGKGSGASAL